MLARRAKDEMYAARHIAEPERLDKPALASASTLLVEPYVSGRTIQHVHRGELVYFRFFWTQGLTLISLSLNNLTASQVKPLR